MPQAPAPEVQNGSEVGGWYSKFSRRTLGGKSPKKGVDASVSIRSPSSYSDGICVIPLHSIAMFTAIAKKMGKLQTPEFHQRFPALLTYRVHVLFDKLGILPY